MPLKKHLSLFIILFLLSPLLHAQLNTFGMSVKKSGSGEQSIILIPGLGCSGAVWNNTKQKLKKEYTCYVITMPGFAGVKPQTDASFKNYVELLSSFIRENHIQKPIVMGHSLGASLTLALASEHPDLVSKIVIVDALPFLLALHDSTAQPNPSECEQDVKETMSLSNEEFYKTMKKNVWRLVADTAAQKDVVDWAIRSDRNTFAKLHCDLTNTDLRDTLTAIKCPSLILLQPYFMDYQQAVETQYKNLQQKKLEYALSGMHFIMMDAFEWYMDKVSLFLRNK
jgi:pimeloyl-ACP methyl ester carboxylesterase